MLLSALAGSYQRIYKDTVDLQPDQKLSHYRLVEKIGEGGMGQVYLAVDTRLDRQVAIKILPEHLADNPTALQRFEREARTVSSLNHPNICVLHDVGQQEGIHFLVMEHLEGETLADRIEKGPLPLTEALTIATQIADALDKAHSNGVLHRDLKPGNIMLTGSGAKLLDFGLAKSADAPGGPISSVVLTRTSPLTADGSIVGTFQYMSPEQLEGKPVDARSDIFSFGAVIYEMLTGRRVFEATSQASLIVAIMSKDPPRLSIVLSTSPPALDRVVQRCLAKKPEDRWHSAADLASELRWIAEGESGAGTSTTPATASSSGTHAVPAHRSGLGRERWAWMAAVVVLLSLVLGALLFPRPAPPGLLIQTSLIPPQGLDFAPRSPFAPSPDGRSVAFVVTRTRSYHGTPAADYKPGPASGIWLRELADPQPRFLEGTGGASYPFWSPDNRWIGFFANGKLNKINVRGGPVVPLCDAGDDGRGGSWSKNGTIIFQSVFREPLRKVSAGGGPSEIVTRLNQERYDLAHRWPQFLPDGSHFIFFVVSTTNPASSEHSGIYLGSLESGEIRILLRSVSRGLYSQGHLLYRAGTTLMGHPFDAGTMELTGEPTPVATDVPGGAISWGGGHFGVSDEGLLVHLRGTEASNSVLTWYDLEGNVLGNIGDMDGYWGPSLSPDGSQIAVSIGEEAGDIWLHDLERDVRTRFTFHSADDASPLWSPGGNRIAFTSARKSVGEIYMRPVSGQGQEELVYESGSVSITLTDWSAVGQLIVFSLLSVDSGTWDIWTFDPDNSEAVPIVAEPFHQKGGRLSPNGRWLAYASDESGKYEIYVRAFPGPGGRWMVSSDGGENPVWQHDGRRLIYQGTNQVLMQVDVNTESAFSTSTPSNLFPVNLKATDGNRYLITADGKRILANELAPTDLNKAGAMIIQNWTVALNR